MEMVARFDQRLKSSGRELMNYLALSQLKICGFQFELMETLPKHPQMLQSKSSDLQLALMKPLMNYLAMLQLKSCGFQFELMETLLKGLVL